MKGGIGVVLAQQGPPIANMSKALGQSKRAWSVHEKKCYSLHTKEDKLQYYCEALGYRVIVLILWYSIKIFSSVPRDGKNVISVSNMV